MKKTVTVGYLLKLHPRLTNCSTLKELLIDKLDNVVLDPSLAVELDLALATKQTKAMSNGDMFIQKPPPFKIYQTEISCGCDKTRVKMEVLGLKCSIKHVQLLKEFLSQIANPMEMEKQIGMFVPTRAVHIIGPTAYTNLLCANNEFLDSITMVPVGDFQHKMLDIPFLLDTNTDIDQTTLYQRIHNQSWCIHVKQSLTPNKVILVTTKGQLTTAQKWTDKSLPLLYQQHISDKIDVTMLKDLTPWCLDKPTVMAASTTYADKLKLRLTCTPSSTAKPNQSNWPHVRASQNQY